MAEKTLEEMRQAVAEIREKMAATASCICSRFFSAIGLSPPRYILRARRR